uniref:Uncharacterized protein n=1 Tax=Anguilla anguilla TaxID=7936 RepID=A0A0E9URV7_ANGAN
MHFKLPGSARPSTRSQHHQSGQQNQRTHVLTQPKISSDRTAALSSPPTSW